jgi:hypothetical protein
MPLPSERRTSHNGGRQKGRVGTTRRWVVSLLSPCRTDGNLVDLGGLNAFVAVAKAKGFRDGARASGGSASGLSEALRRLETPTGCAASSAQRE